MATQAQASADKFGAPKTSADMDQGKLKKLAQRVEETLSSDCLFKEPKQIDPNLVLVAPMNRLGGSPNVRHVHYGILMSFLKHAFDRSRPAIGICIEYRSELGIKRLLEHNRRFSSGNKLLPPILAEVVGGILYGSIACTHLNIAFRAIKNDIYSPIGNLGDLMTNANLKEVVLNGHRWWVLQENCAKERQIDISLWRNQDQNENQQTHELEILLTIKVAAETFLKDGKSTVAMGDLVAAAQKRNPAKISPTTWMTLSKYYIGFLVNGCVDLVEDLHEFHSDTIDPRELCVSISFFGAVESEEALKKCPHVRHHLVTTQYTVEKVKAQAGGPAMSQFIEISQIVSFCKKPDQVNQLEKTIRDLKGKYLPILEQSLSQRAAHLEMTVYIDLIMRCLFSKNWPVNLEPKLTIPVGKFAEEKIQSLGVHWAKVLDLKHPSLGFAKASGLQDESKDETVPDVDLEGLRSLKRNPSSGPDPDVPKFTRGDAVTVVRRMSWSLPQKGAPKYRRDIIEGTEGIMEGWADTEMRQALLKVDLLISGKVQSHSQAVFPRNLKLTSDYLLTKAGEPPSSVPSSSKDVDGTAEDLPKTYKWALGSSDPADVKVDVKWKSLQADDDPLTRTMYLRGRISIGMQALSETLPKYSDKDFVVVHRKNEKGLWKSELHTKRDFEPFEIQFAPFSSQVKESHLMASAHAVVTIPKHGRGAHPENLSLAIDGRSRNIMATKGTLDSEEHVGSLYWVVTRSSNTKEVNLDLDNVTWEHSIKVNLPALKKRKTEVVNWDPSELPSFPLLVNKKAINKHTKLCVFLAEKKKESEKKNGT